jgi:DNA sulfur modification protein DndD
MIIESIKLKNYRQYRDQEIIFAAPENQRNFTVIQGVNGSGKTNLLNAVTWCLYGEEKHLDKNNLGLPIISAILCNELESGEHAEVEVEIRMRDDKNKKVIFKRTLQFRKSQEGTIMKVPDPLSGADGSRFEVFMQKGNAFQLVSSPEYVVKRHIPKDIEEFFFFDGERLNNYFREVTGEKIRNEVFKVSQLDSLEKAIDHLQKKEKDFLRENRELSPKAQEIREKLDIYEKSLVNAKEKLKDLREQRKEAQAKVGEYSEKLRTSSAPNVSRLEEDRVYLEQQSRKIEDRIENLEKRKFDYLLRIAPCILAYSAIHMTNELVSEKEEAGDIPPDYKKNFLKKLLQIGECICGTDISQDNECRIKIEQLLQQCDDITNISEELTKENAHLGNMLNELNEFRQVQIRYGKEHKSLTEERNRIIEGLETINMEMNGCNIDQIRFWNSKLDEYKKQEESLIAEIGVITYQIQNVEEAITKKKKELDEELKKEEKYKVLRKILGFCENSLNIARGIKENIMEDIREEIELNTKKQFFELIWKKESFKDVRIDENYNISVVHESGMEAMGSLSAGERQVLALSFMAALNSVSGFNAPIIVDTPLSRLSREPKNNIAKNLPNYLEGKQVVLLVTEEEYTADVRERLRERVGKEYRIHFKKMQDVSEAKVIPYGE